MAHDGSKPATSKPATLKTIAEMTGLSLSTVSLSLRDGAAVRAETRRRVQDAAAAVGYVPNRAGVRLRTGRTNVLALALSTERHAVDFTRRLILGIGEGVRETPYHLIVVPEYIDAPVDVARYILETRSADAAILTHVEAQDPRVKLLLEAGFPFVCHGRTELYTPHAYCDFDVERFMEMAVDRLRDRGRSRLMLAVFDNSINNYANTIAAFGRVMADRGLTSDQPRHAGPLRGPQDARDFGRALACAGPPPDGIVCNEEITALAMIGGLAEGGLTLGRDYDLICKQTTDILPLLHPTLDTVEEDLFETGRLIARLAVDLASGATTTASHRLLPPVARWRAAAR